MVESIRQSVEKHMPISLRTIFDELDWLKRGFLTSSEFRRYFTGYPDETASLREKAAGCITSQVEMESLLRRFNKDKLNGRVSLPEFMDGLTPKCADKQF
jgi:Ca2+-binding EF-hand superfamily protein